MEKIFEILKLRLYRNFHARLIGRLGVTFQIGRLRVNNIFRQFEGVGMFDVPDFMHVEGTYTTNMVTKAYSTISDYTRALSQYSNTKKGDTSFKDETTERFRN